MNNRGIGAPIFFLSKSTPKWWPEINLNLSALRFLLLINNRIQKKGKENVFKISLIFNVVQQLIFFSFNENHFHFFILSPYTLTLNDKYMQKSIYKRGLENSIKMYKIFNNQTRSEWDWCSSVPDDDVDVPWKWSLFSSSSIR